LHRKNANDMYRSDATAFGENPRLCELKEEDNDGQRE
jgi:hypothetical protein